MYPHFVFRSEVHGPDSMLNNMHVYYYCMEVLRKTKWIRADVSILD